MSSTRTPYEAGGAAARPSSHVRLSTAGALYVRFAASETVIRRRLLQIVATEAKLGEMGIDVPRRQPIEPPAPPERPAQFDAKAQARSDRSEAIVRRTIARLKSTTCRARSPGKREIARESRKKENDPEGRGVSINVFRTNQRCLDLYIAACLPKHVESRRTVATPSWAVRMERRDLEQLVLATERDRDQLTRELMTANELIVASEVAAVRRRIVAAKAERLLRSAD